MRRSIARLAATTLCAVVLVTAACGRSAPVTAEQVRGRWAMVTSDGVFATPPRGEVSLDFLGTRSPDRGTAFESSLDPCPARWVEDYAVVGGRLRLGRPAPVPAIGCLGDVPAQTKALAQFLDAAPELRFEGPHLVLSNGNQRLEVARAPR